jgi:hypothetical protein
MKKKEIKFQPSTPYGDIYFEQPTPAVKFIPQWYKDLKPFWGKNQTKPSIITGTHLVNSTMKKCTPFFDAMTSGYMLSLSSDIEVERDHNGRPFMKWRGSADIVTEHGVEQYEGFPIPDGYEPIVFKWQNEWSMITPKGYSLFFTHPVNRFDLPFLVVSGFIDTDNHLLPIQVPFLIKKDFEGIIERGTAIAQVFPIKRDHWISVKLNYDYELFTKFNQKLQARIRHTYKTLFWEKKNYE